MRSSSRQQAALVSMAPAQRKEYVQQSMLRYMDAMKRNLQQLPQQMVHGFQQQMMSTNFNTGQQGGEGGAAGVGADMDGLDTVMHMRGMAQVQGQMQGMGAHMNTGDMVAQFHNFQGNAGNPGAQQQQINASQVRMNMCGSMNQTGSMMRMHAQQQHYMNQGSQMRMQVQQMQQGGGSNMSMHRQRHQQQSPHQQQQPFEMNMPQQQHVGMEAMDGAEQNLFGLPP